MSPPEAGRDRPSGPTLGGEEAERRCASCREIYPNSALDQRLWCPPCRDALKRRARIGSHLAALVVTVPFGIWILVTGSSEVLSPLAWVMPLGAAYYLGWRIGRELIEGWVRLQARREGEG